MTGVDREAGAILAIHGAAAGEYGDDRAIAVGRDIQSIVARLAGDECEHRRVDLIRLTDSQIAHTQIQRALRQLDLRGAIVQIEQIERTVVVDAYCGIAHLQRCASVTAGQQAVAGHQRPIASGAIPQRFASWSELHIATGVGQPCDPGWRIVAKPLRANGTGIRQQGHRGKNQASAQHGQLRGEGEEGFRDAKLCCRTRPADERIGFFLNA